MILFLIKIVFYLAITMSVLTTFYYVELYNKLLKEVQMINKKLSQMNKTKKTD
jgi:hypothetical protein